MNKKEVKPWHFWNPTSGIVDGCILGTIIGLLLVFVFYHFILRGI